MWSYHPDLLAKPVPRYTSYPTAMEFAEDVGADDYARALDAVDSATPVSLYVHIPFCENICWYCGCNTGRSEEHTSELQSLMRISYAVFCLKKKKKKKTSKTKQ